ncbi:MAG TPA: alpha/beta hydrolase [Marmoricola sp.]|jgi:acetyl esterase/lipase|nr:alpha/beta hydrolase [Marmoricola sp.]
MAFSYAARQLVIAGLAANAVRPLGGRYGSIPAFAAGWLTSELAPQLLALSAADTAAELTLRRRRRRGAGNRATSRLGLVAAAVGIGTLGHLVRGAMGSGETVEGTLKESLGADYLDRLEQPLDVPPHSTWRELARPFKLTDPGVEVIRDINYRVGGSRARLDIYRPRGVDLHGAPVLFQVHGGGWTIGDKSQQGLLLMNRMAQRGWICVASNYALAPKHPFPAQIIDVKKALDWVRQHIGEYGGDPSYIVITGGSAGGHLAALAALTPDVKEFQPGFEDADTHVSACVPFYGVYDLAGLTGDQHAVGMRDWFLGPRVFRKDPREHLEDFVRASPLAHVAGHTPDFFVLHGANDSLVDVGQARQFVRMLREKSDASVTYSELPGAQHAFEVFGSIRSHHVIKAVERWLEWHRATRREATSEGGSVARKSENPLADDVAEHLRRTSGDGQAAGQQ